MKKMNRVMCKVMNTFICRGCSNPVTSTGRTSVDIGARGNLEVVDKFCYLGDMLSVAGDADAAVEVRIRIGSNKFRQLVPLLTNRDILLIIRRGGLYNSSCVRSSMLHGSETWPVRKENEVALQQAEMRMVRWMTISDIVVFVLKREVKLRPTVRWMCNVKVKDKVPSKDLRETRNRLYNIGTTAKQVGVVWACITKRKTRIG